jgi:hypothetical protein
VFNPSSFFPSVLSKQPNLRFYMKRKNRRLFYKGAVVNPVPEIQALLASAGTKSLHYVQAICSLLPETDDIQSSLEGYYGKSAPPSSREGIGTGLSGDGRSRPDAEVPSYI